MALFSGELFGDLHRVVVALLDLYLLALMTMAMTRSLGRGTAHRPILDVVVGLVVCVALLCYECDAFFLIRDFIVLLTVLNVVSVAILLEVDLVINFVLDVALSVVVGSALVSVYSLIVIEGLEAGVAPGVAGGRRAQGKQRGKGQDNQLHCMYFIF